MRYPEKEQHNPQHKHVAPQQRLSNSAPQHKTPEWNPRSLSTFSTFGGSGSPPHVNGQNGHHQLLHAALEYSSGSGEYHSSLSSCSSSPSASLHQRQGSSPGGRPDVIPRSRPPTPLVRTILPVSAPKLPPQTHFKHAHTRSLVGDPPVPPIVPTHAHTRSLLDHTALYNSNPPNSPTSPSPDHTKVVNMFLGPCDRRFGFSVVGGRDEHHPAKIDDIAVGSPADKADLEVGDEILEVNGKSLEDATHTEVIAHIHQCIRSRTICLRVKRRTGSKLAVDLAASANVQDAFVIAVEQQARERLERLSALKKIKPVDMTKLPSEEEDQQVDKQSTADDHNNISTDNSTAGATKTTASSGSHKNSVTTTAIVNSTRSNGYEQQPGERHYKDPASQIYVTSVPSLASPAGKRSSRRESKRQQRQSNDRGVSSSDEARHDSDPDPYKSGDELELTQDLSRDEDEEGRRRARGSARSCEPVDDHQGLPSGDRSEDELDRSTSQKNEVDGGCLSESGDSLPGTPEKTYGLVSDSRSAGRGTGGKKKREVLLDPPSLDTSNSLRGTKLPLTATSSGASSSSRKSGSSGGTEERRRSQVAVGLCQVQPSTEAVLDDNSMISMVEFNPATREMAVDVPESFIGRTKTPPRYPPPKHAVSPHNNNIYTNSKKRGSGGESSGSATPLNGTLSYPGELNQAPVLVQTPNSQEEQNRIKKYEDEIRLRREREEEELMLRSSLRSSQKLQSLASQLPPAPVHGVDNRAFVQQEDTTTTVNNITPHTLNSNVASPTGFNELIQSLQRIENVLQNGHRINEDVALVAQLFSNPDFQKVFAVHNKVQQTCCVNRPPTPVEHGAQELVNQVLHVVQSSSSPDASELVDILNKHSMEGLIFAHDHVANRQPVKAPERVMPGEVTLDQPQLPSNYQNDMVKIVRIDKTNDPLGATIRNEDGAVIIGRIVKGGAAEKSGQLHEGDEILEVNGVEVRSKDVNDVCMMLTGMTGTLTFIIAPRSAAPQEPPMPILAHADMVVVKALFDYDHEADPYLPCRELGISFEKGDILRVISQEDENWWQAFKEGDNNQSLAGLIPSKKFQEQREASKPTVVGDTNNKEKAKKSKQLLCAKKPQKKKKKKMLYSNYNDDFDNEEILSYEEVELYYPKVNYKRPVVLIGPPNIGRHELRQKLMEDSDRFAAAIPHTSRPRRDKEVEGVDYHFITKAEFERDILNRKFVEHGEYEKAFYGTSFESIRDVVRKDKICVLNLHPLCLKKLKNSDLMPFVVFVAAPSIEVLRQRNRDLGENYKDEELKDIIERAREMEDQYSHYFDIVITVRDVDQAYHTLLGHINMLEREPQWVPASWIANRQQQQQHNNQ